MVGSRIPLFEGEEPLKWIEQVEVVWFENDLTDAASIKLVFPCFVGKAKAWIESNMNLILEENWCSLMYNILLEFQEEKTEEAVQNVVHIKAIGVTPLDSFPVTESACAVEIYHEEDSYACQETMDTPLVCKVVVASSISKVEGVTVDEDCRSMVDDKLKHDSDGNYGNSISNWPEIIRSVSFISPTNIMNQVPSNYLHFRSNELGCGLFKQSPGYMISIWSFDPGIIPISGIIPCNVGTITVVSNEWVMVDMGNVMIFQWQLDSVWRYLRWKASVVLIRGEVSSGAAVLQCLLSSLQVCTLQGFNVVPLLMNHVEDCCTARPLKDKQVFLNHSGDIIQVVQTIRQSRMGILVSNFSFNPGIIYKNMGSASISLALLERDLAAQEDFVPWEKTHIACEFWLGNKNSESLRSAKHRVDITAVVYTLSGTFRTRLSEYDKRSYVQISSRYVRVHVFGKLVLTCISIIDQTTKNFLLMWEPANTCVVMMGDCRTSVQSKISYINVGIIRIESASGSFQILRSNTSKDSVIQENVGFKLVQIFLYDVVTHAHSVPSSLAWMCSIAIGFIVRESAYVRPVIMEVMVHTASTTYMSSLSHQFNKDNISITKLHREDFAAVLGRLLLHWHKIIPWNVLDMSVSACVLNNYSECDYNTMDFISNTHNKTYDSEVCNVYGQCISWLLQGLGEKNAGVFSLIRGSIIISFLPHKKGTCELQATTVDSHLGGVDEDHDTVNCYVQERVQFCFLLFSNLSTTRKNKLLVFSITIEILYSEPVPFMEIDMFQEIMVMGGYISRAECIFSMLVILPNAHKHCTWVSKFLAALVQSSYPCISTLQSYKEPFAMKKVATACREALYVLEGYLIFPCSYTVLKIGKLYNRYEVQGARGADVVPLYASSKKFLSHEEDNGGTIHHSELNIAAYNHNTRKDLSAIITKLKDEVIDISAASDRLGSARTSYQPISEQSSTCFKSVAMLLCCRIDCVPIFQILRCVLYKLHGWTKTVRSSISFDTGGRRPSFGFAMLAYFTSLEVHGMDNDYTGATNGVFNTTNLHKGGRYAHLIIVIEHFVFTMVKHYMTVLLLEEVYREMFRLSVVLNQIFFVDAQNLMCPDVFLLVSGYSAFPCMALQYYSVKVRLHHLLTVLAVICITAHNLCFKILRTSFYYLPQSPVRYHDGGMELVNNPVFGQQEEFLVADKMGYVGNVQTRPAIYVMSTRCEGKSFFTAYPAAPSLTSTCSLPYLQELSNHLRSVSTDMQQQVTTSSHLQALEIFSDCQVSRSSSLQAQPLSLSISEQPIYTCLNLCRSVVATTPCQTHPIALPASTQPINTCSTFCRSVATATTCPILHPTQVLISLIIPFLPTGSTQYDPTSPYLPTNSALHPKGMPPSTSAHQGAPVNQQADLVDKVDLNREGLLHYGL